MGAIRNFILFGSFPRGDSVHFIGRGTMFLDRNEIRARMLKYSFGVSQPRVTYAWIQANKLISPDLVIDAGANYGEIVLSALYPEGSKVFVVEANPILASMLKNSLATRTDSKRGQFSVIDAALAENTGQGVLKVAAESSGLSHLESGPYSNLRETQESDFTVEVTSLDQLTQDIPAKDLLFKLDIEGGEVAALKGGGGSCLRR